MRRRVLSAALSALAATMACPSLGSAGEPFTDPADAGPDYAAQGEYAGHILLKGRKTPYAAQVIALGNGRFQAVFYAGGLPGAGWDGSARVAVDGRREKDGVAFEPAKGPKEYLAGGETFSALEANPPEGQRAYAAAVAGNKLAGRTDKGDAFVLDRTVRKSPTLGAPPPPGAIVLLPYKAGAPPPLDGWTNRKWKAMPDGSMMVTPQSGNTTSVEAFGGSKFHLHLEFTSPFMPGARGQGRGNSGVFPPPGREVQVLDSFGLQGLPNECGGLYKDVPPKVNMCLPPLTWQTYDILFRNNAYQIHHNGVLIHEKIEAGGAKKGLELQDHNDPVRYRNIWVNPDMK